MPELQSLSPNLLLHIAQTLHLPLKSLTATIELLDEGGTAPSSPANRKEATSNLDEVQIRAIEENSPTSANSYPAKKQFLPGPLIVPTYFTNKS